MLLRAASTPSSPGMLTAPDVLAETTSDDEGRFVFEDVPVPASMSQVTNDLDDWEHGADVSCRRTATA